MQSFGIDLSELQGDFRMIQAKREGVEFIIAKAGGGDAGLYVDPCFKDNYDKAKALKLPVGCYWVSKAMSVEEAKSEAEFFYQNALRGRKFDLPIYVSVENQKQMALGKRALTGIVKAWLEYLRDKGFFVGIHSSIRTISERLYDSKLQDYPHWILHWGTELNDACGMWQFSGEGNYTRSPTVAGVTCNQDYMFIDYPSLIKASGLNGFRTSTPVRKTSDGQSPLMVNVPLPVLRLGDSGDYVRSLQILLNIRHEARLQEDGEFGPDTEDAVLSYQHEQSLTESGWVESETWSQLLK